MNAVVSLPKPFLLLYLLLMLFLDFHYVLSEDADPIIGSKVFVAIEISEF